MAVTSYNYDNAWATLINAASITNGGSSTSATVTHDGKAGTEFSVEVAYGATATAGLTVYVVRDIDGTNYEAIADVPWSFEMPRAVSATFRRAFTWYGENGATIKILLVNNTGATITATVRYKQFTVDTV